MTGRRDKSRTPAPAETAAALLGTKPAPAGSWRYNTVAGTYFAGSAFIQLQDPDPLVRLLGYFIGGTCWSIAALLFPGFTRRCAVAVTCIWIFVAGMLTGLALPLVHWPETAATAEFVLASVPAFVHVQTGREALGALLLAVHTVCAPRATLRFREKAVFVVFAIVIALWVFQPDLSVRAPPEAFAAR